MTMHDGIVRQRDRFKKIIASKDTSSYKVVYPRQLVVGFPIDEGVIYVQNFDEPGIMSPAYNVWDVDNSKVNPVYLELALHSPQTMTYYAAQMKGTTARRRTLSTDKLRDIKISLPPMDKQVEIVARFKRIKELLRVGDERISNLDELVKSRFVEMFGTLEHPRYAIVELQDICAYIVDCPHETPKYDGILEYPAIRTSELAGTTIDWSSMKYVSEEEYQRRTRRLIPQPGDIVYAREGTYGSAAILPDGYRFCLGQRTMLFRTDASVCLPQYLLFAITSPDVKGQADLLNVGSTVPHVNVKDAKRFRIPLPSLALQREFADFAARIDKLRFGRAKC